MTIKRTREILGKLVEDMTDEQIARMIETYGVLADMVLEELKQEQRRNTTKKSYNA